MNLYRCCAFSKLSRQARLLFCFVFILSITPPYDAHPVQAEPARPIPVASFFAATESAPKNIILMIGDGMGDEHVIASGMYANGVHGSLAFESAPYQALMKTYSANSSVTDSAASATAMATGKKVNNGVVSVDRPGNGQSLQTSLEYFRDRCKATGVVVTSVIDHATPAAFAAHANSRSEYLTLLKKYFQSVKPNVIMGGRPDIDPEPYASEAGYTILSNRAELESLPPTNNAKVYGGFGAGDMDYEFEYQLGLNDFYDEQPHLSEMTTKSLEILEQDPDGFFLMVEGSRIDHAAHANALPQMVHELLEFEKAVDAVLTWAEGRSDTLVIVTADHETGGLVVTQNLGQGALPQVYWGTSAHTGTDVKVYAWGPNAEMVTGEIDNTEIYDITIANAAERVDCATQTSQQPDVPPVADTTEVTLSWQTNSESLISGFHIMRSLDDVYDHAVLITTELIPVAGSSNYEFTDVGISRDVDYTYWLVIVGTDGSTTVSDQIDVPRSRYLNFLPILSQ